MSRLRMLRSIAMKGSLRLSIRLSQVLALFPCADTCVSHVSGTGSFIRCPALSSLNSPVSRDLRNSSALAGYFLPRMHITKYTGLSMCNNRTICFIVNGFTVFEVTFFVGCGEEEEKEEEIGSAHV